MTDEEEKDYPTEYSEADSIEGDVEEWLENQSTEELASQLNRFHAYQLEWFAVNTDDEEKIALLHGEVEAREDYDRSMNKTKAETSTSSTTNGTRSSVWDSGLQILDSAQDLAEHELGASSLRDLLEQEIGARSLEQYAIQELGIEKNKVILSEQVRKICVAIQEEVNEDHGGACEFGVLFKGEWTDEGFIVKPDYVIPEQKASRAHITYTEDLKKYRDEGYIVNIHSHPWAGESSGFSGTDDDHINSHFNMAVLFAGGAETFADAVANVEVENGVTARINPEVVVESPDRELPDIEGMENVTVRKRSSKRGSKNHGRRTDYGKKEARGHRPPKGSYERYKQNYGSYFSEDDEKQNLPQSQDELDESQKAFTEVDWQ